MKNLNKEIAKLKAEQSHQKKVIKLLGKINHLAFITGHDNEIKRVVVKTKSIEEVKKAFNVFPPSNKTTVIGFAGKNDIILKTPFRMDIENPCSPNQHNNFELNVSFESIGMDVQIEVPLNLIPDKFLVRGQRPIIDSEYHYFIGHSMNELRNIRVMQYSFMQEQKQIGWYGGNKTLTDVKGIESILKELLG